VFSVFGARVWEGDILIIRCTRVCYTCVYVLEAELWTTAFLTKIGRYKAMPWLRGLVAGYSPRRPGLVFGPVHVGYVVDSGTGTGFSPSS
jgi:hypothetical protein